SAGHPALRACEGRAIPRHDGRRHQPAPASAARRAGERDRPALRRDAARAPRQPGRGGRAVLLHRLARAGGYLVRGCGRQSGGRGEYGREWHKGGQLMNKPNTWRDLIDVCEELCAKKYTARSRLAIGGRSAGGITVGRAMTERPELFAAVIDGVGWSNPLRYV